MTGGYADIVGYGLGDFGRGAGNVLILFGRFLDFGGERREVREIASQGASIQESRANLIEALALFFAIGNRSGAHYDVFVTQVEVRAF